MTTLKPTQHVQRVRQATTLRPKNYNQNAEATPSHGLSSDA